MAVDFTKIIDRRNLDSHKWATMLKKGPKGPDIVPFTVADYDFEMMPEIKEALHQAIESIPMGYTYGSESYFQSIIDFVKRHYNYVVNKDDILESSGVVASIDEMIKIFTKENEQVLVFTPVYTPFMKTIEKNNRECVKFGLTYQANYSIDFIKLEQLFKANDIKLLIWCSPHNPVGRVWTKEELVELTNLCLKYQVIIVSDEIHSNIILEPHQHHMTATICEDNTITLISPTKTFNLAGMHVSQILVKGELKNKIIEYRKKSSNPGLSVLARVACEAAYNKGDDYIQEFNQLIKTNHLLVKTFIESKIQEIKVINLEGSYLQWLDFSAFDVDEKELKRIFEDEYDLFFNEGQVYGTTEGVFFRMNLAYPTEIVTKGLERLENWYLFHVKQSTNN